MYKKELKPPASEQKGVDENTPKLYRELAGWWPIFSAPADYKEEAEFFNELIRENCQKPPLTLLELGSGGGNNASFLKSDFQMTLVDLSPEMLTVSRKLNPECEHLEGDMRSARLNRQFDAVFIHDAVMYITAENDLGKVMETAFIHCRPGGAALFSPDWVRETFKPGTDHGGFDGDSRSLRYLEWTFDPDPHDTLYTVEFAILLRDETGHMHIEHDRHILGLFNREVWMRLLLETGFQPQIVKDPYEREVFIALKPGTQH
jgi:SAM-dependent methyltransferase